MARKDHAVKTLRAALLIACGIATQSHVTLVLAQDGATLVTLSTRADQDDETALEANHYFEYAFESSAARVALAAIAYKRASDEHIREFARGMIKAENDFRHREKALAEKHSFRRTGNSPSPGSACNLASAHEEEFNATFVTCTISLLEKDIEILRRTAECEDRWVRLLASERLTVAEDQLAQLRAIRNRTLVAK